MIMLRGPAAVTGVTAVTLEAPIRGLQKCYICHRSALTSGNCLNGPSGAAVVPFGR